MLENRALSDEASAAAADQAFVEHLIGQCVGNYVIERPLAQGGMGSVFVAKHPRLGREVAVKFLSPQVSASEEHAQRFLGEARVTANLNHPNIVDIFDFGELNGRLYYVMELLRGRSLRAEMRARGRFGVERMQRYLEQICAGLHAAHDAGVVHRDLKPGNIFVSEGEPAQIKLLDFGVAKVLSTGGPQTRHGQVLGTPTHMAPEQAMGDVQRITAQSDLYSLGVVAYEMLTGSPLFRHESELMLMVMHVRDPVRPVRELAPHVHERVAEVVERCLAKDPKDRPASARALAEELAEATRFAVENPIAGEPGVASELMTDEPQLASASGEETVSQIVAVAGSLGTDNTVAGTMPRRTARSNAPTRAAPLEPPPLTAGPTTLASNAPALVAVAAPPIVLQAPAVPPPLPSAAPATLISEVLAAQVAASAAVPTPEAAAPAEAAPAPEPEVKAPEPRERADTPLSATAQSTLSKLLLRLQRKGDFPAFAQAVGEVTKKADADGAYSAGQLGESILKDYSLTAKLLRVVNSMYANRFGGKIYSVQHAIVLLGFDRVRSLALSISLFKGSGKNAQSQHVSDSAIAAIVTGEIARNLAAGARVSDEEALVCAMFRDLGRHLVIVYLPELYAQAVELSERDGLSVRVAAERVLGTSFWRLGLAIAQNWRLPPRILGAISASPNQGGALPRMEDRLSALSEFSSELCEIVATEAPAERDRAVTDLLFRHKNLLGIDPDALLEVLARVRDSLHERYSKLLGLDVKASRFLNNLPRPTGEGEEVSGAEAAPRGASQDATPAPARAETVQAERDVPVLNESVLAKPTVARLELARAVAAPARHQTAATKPSDEDTPLPELERKIEEVRAALAAGHPSDAVLNMALRVIAHHLATPRLLVLTKLGGRDELGVRFGFRDDVEQLVKELRLPLKSARGPANVFASAFNSGRDVIVQDAFAKQPNAPVPVRYFEVIGSPAFALYSCVGKGLSPALILVELEAGEELPAPERVAELAKLRPLIAQAAARF